VNGSHVAAQDGGRLKTSGCYFEKINLPLSAGSGPQNTFDGCVVRGDFNQDGHINLEARTRDSSSIQSRL